MTRTVSCVLGALVLFAGCSRAPRVVEAPWRPVNLYVAPDFPWASVQRIVIMPLANWSEFPEAAEQMREALAAQFQNSGRFDVVVAPYNAPGPHSAEVLKNGTYDELAVLELARRYQAQGVLYGAVTQDHPYSLPRVGLTLTMISPYEGVVIAGGDELWDARERIVADELRQHHYRHLDWPESLFYVDRALESPEVFRRYVGWKVARAFEVLTTPLPPELAEKAKDGKQPPEPPGAKDAGVKPAGHDDAPPMAPPPPADAELPLAPAPPADDPAGREGPSLLERQAKVARIGGTPQPKADLRERFRERLRSTRLWQPAPATGK
ncbi:MAG: hypothetical protein KY476_01195 [Planctomycetes bacterium]|nr:hypothetical protein [Planctomycetota bacterium]